MFHISSWEPRKNKVSFFVISSKKMSTTEDTSRWVGSQEDTATLDELGVVQSDQMF